MSRETIARIRAFWADEGDFGVNAARGGVVMIASRVVIKGLHFIRTLILARLLFPHDFGLFALASVAIGFADLISQPGFNTSLIQEKGDIKPYLSSVWTANILRNSAIALALCAASPALARYFEEPALALIIPGLALATVLTGFENPGIVYFQKEIRFKRKFVLDTLLVLGDLIVVVIAGAILHNVWALVVGSIGNRVIAVILSFWLHPFRPRFALEWRKVRSLMRFGKWVWATGVLTFVIGKIDVVAIGKLLDPESLGYYQAAIGLAMLPAVEIARALFPIAYPYYARVREDRAALGRAFTAATSIMLAASLPILFGLLAVAPEGVMLLYGEKWLPMAPVLAIVVFYGMGRSIEYFLVPLALALGRPFAQTAGAGVQGVLLAALVPIFVAENGIEGAAVAIVIAMWASVGTIFLFCLFGLRELPGWLFRAAIAPLAASVAMYAVVMAAKDLWGQHWGVILAGSIMLGVASYAALLFGIDRISGRTVFSAVRAIRGKL